ncbi:MAG: exodeoxyribonuclease III [Myxococcales bacterium 68-20]|nr:MAG: exodeoxyribonuclease III [Myxococcales bacterium 68-20]
MLLATWNVNGIRARSQRLAEFLAERQPDIVCLQELKVVEDDFPHLELRASGYQAELVGQQGWNGVAVLAKERPELVMRELPGAGEHGARFVVAKVHGLEVASIYVPNGKTLSHADYKMKLGWLDRLATYVESRADKNAPLVLGGDFNVCWTDLDSYGGLRFKGRIFHTDEERALIERLRAAGLVDLFRSRYPEEPGFSWWDYRAGSFHKKEGLRIDLLLATPVVANRVKDVYVDRDYRKKGKTSGSIPSDHAPVVAVLD